MNTKSDHPKSFLDKNLLEEIAGYAREAEQAGALHPEQLKIIYAQQWMKMYVPRKEGGLGLSLPEILKIEEALSYADGSTGWVITLCSGAGWFYGFLDPNVATEFFKDPKFCFAGSGAITGIATITDKGYLVNGCWKYASGSIHATGFTANCRIKNGEQPVLNEDGSPKILSFLFKPHEVKINRTWHAMGMVATGSYSFEVNQVEVPFSRTFNISADHTTHYDPIFRFPFLQLAETTLAVNLSGMAVRFLDLCLLLLAQREKFSDIKNAEASQDCRETLQHLHKKRSEFHSVAQISWNELIKSKTIDEILLKRLSQLSSELVDESRRAVNQFYPFCGIAAADARSDINRVWRNFHTAGQHALFNSRKTLQAKCAVSRSETDVTC